MWFLWSDLQTNNILDSVGDHRYCIAQYCKAVTEHRSFSIHIHWAALTCKNIRIDAVLSSMDLNPEALSVAYRGATFYELIQMPTINCHWTIMIWPISYGSNFDRSYLVLNEHETSQKS